MHEKKRKSTKRIRTSKKKITKRSRTSKKKITKRSRTSKNKRKTANKKKTKHTGGACPPDCSKFSYGYKKNPMLQSFYASKTSPSHLSTPEDDNNSDDDDNPMLKGFYDYSTSSFSKIPNLSLKERLQETPRLKVPPAVSGISTIDINTSLNKINQYCNALESNPNYENIQKEARDLIKHYSNENIDFLKLLKHGKTKNIKHHNCVIMNQYLQSKR